MSLLISLTFLAILKVVSMNTEFDTSSALFALSFLAIKDLFFMINIKDKFLSKIYLIPYLILFVFIMYLKMEKLNYVNIEFLAFLFVIIGLFLLYISYFYDSFNKVKIPYLLGILLYALSILPVINSHIIYGTMVFSLFLIRDTLKKQNLLLAIEDIKDAEHKELYGVYRSY